MESDPRFGGAPMSTLQPSYFGAGSGAPSAHFDRDATPPPGAGLDCASGGTRTGMLEPAMFLGLGAVAFWLYVRCPRLRPNSILRAAVHVAASFLAFALLPAALGRLLPLLPSHVLQLEVVLALLLPLFTYVLLSWIWLVARVLHDLFGGTPRGGHPVSGES
jgi:hypothetical protein